MEKAFLVKKKIKEIRKFQLLKTKEYPGFPTDLQAQLTSSLTKN